MIKQIAAKKLDSLLTSHLSGYALTILTHNFPPSKDKADVLKKVTNKLSLLPPLLKKPAAEVSNSSPLPVSLPDVEEGFLLMGDVVTLIAAETQNMPNTTGVIIGDGIAHNFLDCVPVSSLVTSEKVQFRLCLFRIEPIRQYGYSNMLRTYSKTKEPLDENLARLRLAESEEHADNEDEASVSYGRKITFGDRVQLRHVHSNSFLTATREVSKERGCLEVGLDPKGNEGSWLEVKSCSLIRQDGETVRYSDQFSLRIAIDSEIYYLHMGTPKSWKDELDYALNASCNYTQWQVRKFISHAAIQQNPQFVATGDSFRIRHTKAI
jgi:hypothetical protein